MPTLVMMEGVAANVPVPGLDYAHARETVGALHAAGVPIVLGTDANQAPGVPANVPYGESVHRELELLVEAGLTPAEALHAATGAAADRFGLPDRGRIAVGAPRRPAARRRRPDRRRSPPRGRSGRSGPRARTRDDDRPGHGCGRQPGTAAGPEAARRRPVRPRVRADRGVRRPAP